MTPLDIANWITAILGVPLIAGAIGGIIRWIYLKEDRQQGLTSIVVGAFFSHYLSIFAGHFFASLADWSQVDPAAGRAAGAFLFGIAGIWGVQWVIDFIKRFFEMRKETPDGNK